METTTKQFISNNRTHVANHYVHVTDKNVYLQSYNSVVVRLNKDTKEITLGRDWNSSMTTGEYVKQFIEQYIGKSYSTKELEETFGVEHLTIQ